MLPAGRSKKTKADQMGLSEADQIAMQAALFAKAANAVQVLTAGYSQDIRWGPQLPAPCPRPACCC